MLPIPKLAPAVAVSLLTLAPAAPTLADIATGPEVGEAIPSISAQDQHGNSQTFEDLRGPEGLLLLFYRTADW